MSICNYNVKIVLLFIHWFFFVFLFYQFPDIAGPNLPGKTMLKNMNQEFLEKRRKSLDNYLQVIMY